MNNEEQPKNGSSHPVSIGKAFKLFWTNYVNFKGISSRSEYWWWYLWNFIITLVIGLPMFSVLPRVIQSIMNNDMESTLASVAGPFLISVLALSIYGLATLLPNIGLLLRRLRDTGIPEPAVISLVVARYVLTFLSFLLPFLYSISFILGVVIFVMTLLPSKPQE